MFNLPLLRPSLVTVPYVASGFNPITSGLITWYKFAEGSGTTTSDSSGNSNTGTLVNSPSWVSGVPSSPISPYALSFVQASSQYMTALNLLNSNSSFSVCFWIYSSQLPYPASAVDYHIIGDGFNLGANTGYFIGLDDESNQIYIAVDAGFIESTTVLNPNTWYHVCFTISSGSPYTLNCYINAVLDTPSSISTTNTYTKSSVLNIAGDTTDTDYMTGILDDVRIYNRVLSQTEISEIYNFEG